MTAAVVEAARSRPLRVAVSCHGGGSKPGRTIGRDGTPFDPEEFAAYGEHVPDGHIQRPVHCRCGHRLEPAARRGRTRCCDQHVVGCRLRRSDRSVGLRCRQGWNRLNDPCGGPRLSPPRYPCAAHSHPGSSLLPLTAARSKRWRRRSSPSFNSRTAWADPTNMEPWSSISATTPISMPK